MRLVSFAKICPSNGGQLNVSSLCDVSNEIPRCYVIYTLFHLVFGLYNNIIFITLTCFIYFRSKKCNQASTVKRTKNGIKEETKKRAMEN